MNPQRCSSVPESFFEVMIMRIPDDIRGAGPGRLKRRTRTKKDPEGRASKYAPAVVVRICRAVRNGCSREAAAGLAGISATTLYEWQWKFPQFSQGLQKADSEFEAVCVASIRNAVGTRGTGLQTVGFWRGNSRNATEKSTGT